MERLNKSRAKKIKFLAKELSSKVQDHTPEALVAHIKKIDDEEQLNHKEIFTLFTNGEYMVSAIESAMSRSGEHLRVILDNALINRLESVELFNIINSKDSAGNTVLCSGVRRGEVYINGLLDSGAFLRLGDVHLFEIVNGKCEAGRTALWLVAKKDKDSILAILGNDFIISHLSDTQKRRTLITSDIFKAVDSEASLMTILQSDFVASLTEASKVELLSFPQPPNGDTVIRTFIRKKAPKLLKTFLDSDVLGSLSLENQYKVVTSKWDDTPHIFKFLMKQSSNVLDLFFGSDVFMHFSAVQQRQIVIFSEGIAFWSYVVSQNEYVKKLLDNKNLCQKLQSELSSHFLKAAEYTGRYAIENNRKKDVLEGTVIKVARDYSIYKEIVSEDGYSLLYYLSTQGFNASSLRSLQNEGFKLTMPRSKSVVIYGTHHLYKSMGQKEAVVYLRGPDGTKPINIAGMVSSLHKGGMTVIAIDARDNNEINSVVLRKIINDYAMSHLIKLFIINAHGAGDRYSGMPEIYYGERPHKGEKCGDAEIWLFKVPDKLAKTHSKLSEGTGHYILGKLLIKEIIAKSVSKDLKVPINVLLTSCNGQLIEKWALKELPYGSTIVALGEHNCESMVIHGRVGDLQSVTPAIIRSNHLKSQQSVESLLIAYLLNIEQGLAAPTYIKSGIGILHMSDLSSSIYWLQGLNDPRIEELVLRVCAVEPDCIDKVTKVLEEIKDGNIALGEINKLKAKGDAHNVANKLGIIEALNFEYHYHCTDVFNRNGIDESFCAVSSSTTGDWYETEYWAYGASGLFTSVVVGYGIYCYCYTYTHYDPHQD
ncbi:hypothetical protein EDM53_00920 [Rickettsiales endosymbiont of Peranema trichophorum]|uniref:hypothetical protein n=1 Tax=Rickettsiales endosymbiont of Peranema trichophorum TaxID=2486577 RepID=UPI00102316EF|nr:hypothetical protein [Rickettsiales endosymbiont of Peranema trichophorum]RZI47628.1 hypothetical protein EDM53_00920 [Rickettsiales endosymbiont of Peranema trichophorum]